MDSDASITRFCIREFLSLYPSRNPLQRLSATPDDVSLPLRSVLINNGGDGGLNVPLQGIK
jgi:hypothetical protein